MVNYKGRNWNILATFQLPEGTSNMKTRKVLKKIHNKKRTTYSGEDQVKIVLSRTGWVRIELEKLRKAG